MNLIETTNDAFTTDYFGYFYNSDIREFSDMKDIDKLSLSWFTYEKFYDN